MGYEPTVQYILIFLAVIWKVVFDILTYIQM